MADPSPPDAPVGPGRVLVLAYGFFTLAAGARSLVQLAIHAERAPLAYGLSTVAAGVYATGTVLLTRADRDRGGLAGRAARVLCLLEITGVVVVGAISLARPAWFPDATVWSGFGSGYGYVPVLLPAFALVWLHRAAPSAGPPGGR